MTSAFSNWALSYVRRGFSVVPILAGTKRPGCRGWDGSGWQRYCTDQADLDQLQAWAHDKTAGIGLCGGFGGSVSIDVDDTRAFDPVRRVLGGRGAPTKVGLKGFTGIFRDPTGLIVNRKFSRPEGGHFCEVLAAGNQTVLPPTIHPGDPSKSVPSPGAYRWVRGTLETMRISDLPVITQRDIDDIEGLLAPMMSRPAEKSPITFKPRVDAAALAEQERKRFDAYAHATLRNLGASLAVKSRPGRNRALLDATCTIGKYVHHGILSQQEVTSAFLSACNSNGLAKDNGAPDCLKTIRNGLLKSRDDNLVELENRPRTSHAYS